MTNCDNVEMKNHLYMSVMHSLSIIALFMNLFAFYCIVYKSTKQMGVYQWYLLAYQASSTAFDTLYTGFIIPVIYFPEPMGYPGSWLAEKLSITGHAAVLMDYLTTALLVGCILNLFNYRCHVVTPNHYFFKFGNHGHIYTSSAISLTYFLSIAAGLIELDLPDQEGSKIWAAKKYPCLQSVIYDNPRFTFFALNNGIPLTIIIIVLAVTAAVIAVLCIVLSFYFIRMSGHLSQKTKLMQRRFLIYLCIQVAIPVLTMLVPILVFVYVINGESTNGGLFL